MGGETIIGYCGITCTECPAYQATKAGDMEKLTKTAREWSTSEMSFETMDLLCHGCLSNQVFKWCGQCQTRICGIDRGVENCGRCIDYVCVKLKDHWSKLSDGGAKCQSTLDSIRV